MSRICAKELQAFEEGGEGDVKGYYCVCIFAWLSFRLLGVGRGWQGVEGECGEEFIVEKGMTWGFSGGGMRGNVWGNLA